MLVLLVPPHERQRLRHLIAQGSLLATACSARCSCWLLPLLLLLLLLLVELTTCCSWRLLLLVVVVVVELSICHIQRSTQSACR